MPRNRGNEGYKKESNTRKIDLEDYIISHVNSLRQHMQSWKSHDSLYDESCTCTCLEKLENGNIQEKGLIC